VPSNGTSAKHLAVRTIQGIKSIWESYYAQPSLTENGRNRLDGSDVHSLLCFWQFRSRYEVGMVRWYASCVLKYVPTQADM